MRQLKGFTLIELMVVLVVVGILASLAYPAYQDAVISARRTDAQVMLFDLAQREQQFFSRNGLFTTSLSALDITSSSPEGYYLATLSAGPTGTVSTSYILTATPVVGTSQANDAKCNNLTLNSLGVKGETGTLNADQCWQN